MFSSVRPIRRLQRCGILLPIFLSSLNGCGAPQGRENADSNPLPTSQASMNSPAEPSGSGDETIEDIRLFCGSCHAVPRPDSFPKAMWYEEIRRGFNFYYESGRTDLKPPLQAKVVAYFRDQAPETLLLTEQKHSPESSNKFVPMEVQLQTSEPVAISFIDWQQNAGGSLELRLSDMRTGSIIKVPEVAQQSSATMSPMPGGSFWFNAGVSAHPAAVRQMDLDSNGVADLLVTDLGSYLPEDHDRGKLVWIPDVLGATRKEPVSLWKGIGRVADVQPFDVDGDGGQDLAVAEFGWHKTGSVTLLKQVSTVGEPPRHEPMTLDNRPGAIHVIPHDVDGDGRTDLVALISQEHEQVMAYLNKPSGFQKQVLYAAPDPSWGSSGIQVVDLDRDGDSDIVYTNGDSFDSKIAKPYHGVWWLENKGGLRYTAHHIAEMPGIHRALAADFDNDGDLDLAAAAMLPLSTIEGLNPAELQAVVWLEQKDNLQFTRHVIEQGPPTYAAMNVNDFNGDGKIDIAVGMFNVTEAKSSTVAKVFWNQAK